MATSHSTPESQLSDAPQVKKVPEEVVRLKLDRCLLEVLAQFGGAEPYPANLRLSKAHQCTGIHRALVLIALSFLNSKDQAEMVVDAMVACGKLPAKIAERREIAELTRLYNLPDTEEET